MRVFQWSHMSKRPSSQRGEAGQAAFCLPGHVRRLHLSPANCPISRELRHSAQPLKAWPTLCCVQVEVKGQVGKSLPASQEVHWPFWRRMTTRFSIYRIRGPIVFPTQPLPLKTPPSSFTSGRLLWLYDYIWGFVWLCMYLHHSQLVPINNRAPV